MAPTRFTVPASAEAAARNELAALIGGGGNFGAVPGSVARLFYGDHPVPAVAIAVAYRVHHGPCSDSDDCSDSSSACDGEWDEEGFMVHVRPLAHGAPPEQSPGLASMEEAVSIVLREVFTEGHAAELRPARV